MISSQEMRSEQQGSSKTSACECICACSQRKSLISYGPGVDYNVLPQFFMDHSTASVYFGMNSRVTVLFCISSCLTALHCLFKQNILSQSIHELKHCQDSDSIASQVWVQKASLVFVYATLDGRCNKAAVLAGS